MNTYQALNEQLIKDLIYPSSSNTFSSIELTESLMSKDLQNLINSLPYYQESVSQEVLKNSLVNILENKLPNDRIGAQPSDYGFGYNISYSYNGNYSGYKDAFFNGISLNSISTNILNQIGNIVDDKFWSGYSVALLTDSVRKHISINLDSNALQSALSSYSTEISKILAPSYLGIFTNGYIPTQNSFNSIQNKNTALNELDNAIANGQFTANVNQALSIPGDSASAATWFLFNLWITLKALGMQDVNSAITKYKNNGLNIPIQVDSNNWWQGNYSSWFAPLDGSYINSSTITNSMPQESYTYVSGSMYPSHSSENIQNGYSQSLVNWGSLSYYKAQSSSCFGQNTNILMADFTMKKICEIKIGDFIYTREGAKKIILVESPLRNNRELYQINDLDIYVTYAHPFKSDEKVLAINPWVLKDTITTFGDKGVDYLKIGSILEGKDQKIEVNKIEIIKEEQKDEKVYDLIIEDAIKNNFGYFVGSNNTFVEVFPESANPLSYPFVSTAIIGSMNIIKDTCNISNLKFENNLSSLKLESKELTSNLSVKLATIPGIDFFIKEDGSWDEYSSNLEHNMISFYSKDLRRKIETGWKIEKDTSGNVLCIGINDIELIGRCINETKISFQLKPQDEIVEFSFKSNSKYAPKIDDVLYVNVDNKPNSIYIYFMDLVSHINLERIHQRCSDYFLYDKENNIVGSINLEFRYLTPKDILLEQEQKKNYSYINKINLAINLGKNITDCLYPSSKKIDS
ncbi:Hint domain-containing protein [Aliarcobacter butzleri]|uniref:Hint domain-containing protein n=1 Tax=Aliarcobacter butzleri TaxID=28197 RepID=UPI001ED9D9CC|nr:Hint domain-containing protein [Aliarcobacter butzleri]MCG3651383.1 Hint domain-containing protein [Aliarcobacter butzleri]